MSLRTRIVVILVAVVLGWAAADNGVLRLFASRIFGNWERQEAGQDLARVQRRLQSELEELYSKARIHSGSRSVRDLLSGAGSTPLEGDTLELTNVDLFYVVDGDGTVVWGRIVDPESRQPIKLAEFPGQSLSHNNVVLAFHADEQRVSGILLTKEHPLLFCTLPIPDAEGKSFQEGDFDFRAPSFGAVVLGRFLGEGLRQKIVSEELADAQSEGDDPLAHIDLFDPDDPALPEAVRADPRPESFLVGQDGLLHAYAKVGSLRTGVPLVLHVALERMIAERGHASVNYALLSTLASALLILFVLLRLLQRHVVEPLSALSAKAVEIGRSDDTMIRVGMQRSDEIGQLAGEFDSMLEKLARSREQVIETARLAGMSEIATGVLHNVGNVLNSVNVSANLAAAKAKELSTMDLEMLVEVLKQNESDLAAFVEQDPRGKHLVPFLGEISKALSGQRRAIEGELQALGEGIEHIADLVRAQQSFAGTKGVFEKVVLERELEAALRICEVGGWAEVAREFAPVPPVRVDRRKLLEILVNLIQNAGQAIRGKADGQRRITLRILRPQPDLARIEVEDSGVGIAPENLTKVFNHGFTTKAQGHGFGLHASANAATEMGAKLQGRSGGSGQGATFWIDMQMEETAVATV